MRKQDKHLNNHNDDWTAVEPISPCILREHHDKSGVEVKNQFGKVILDSNAAKEFLCHGNDEYTAPYTITSDNQICVKNETFICKTCHRQYHKSKEAFCRICQKTMCINCINTSACSDMTICDEHTKKCKTCKTTIATDEAFICSSCGKAFCSCYTHLQRCSVCNDILCDSCKNTSKSSGLTLCSTHAKSCILCKETVGEHEMAVCTSCGLSYCGECIKDGLCSLCGNLEEVNKNSTELISILNRYKLKANTYEYSQLHNIAVVVGKSLFGKSFLVAADLNTDTLLNKIEYFLFGKKI